MSEGKAVFGQSKTVLSKGIELPLALGINDQTRGNHRRKAALESSLSPLQSLSPTGSVSGVENLLLQTAELEEPGGLLCATKEMREGLGRILSSQIASDSRQKSYLP